MATLIGERQKYRYPNFHAPQLRTPVTRLRKSRMGRLSFLSRQTLDAVHCNPDLFSSLVRPEGWLPGPGWR